MGLKQSKCVYDFNTLRGNNLTSLLSLQEDATQDVRANANEMLSNQGLTYKMCVNEGRKYSIIKMDKSKMTSDDYKDVGKFRSVIFRNGMLRCIAPPKSITFDSALEMPQFSSGTRATEFIEGTMINLFWDDGEWRIATRSSVGGRVGFFTTNNTRCPNYENTFRWMFYDAINLLEEENPDSKKFFTMLDEVPHDVCISCVLQHPKNRIVLPFLKPSIYVVAAYRISNMTAEPIDVYQDQFSSILPSWVKYPANYQYSDFYQLVEQFASVETDYKTLGVMINSACGEFRTKVRNQAYEKVRHLRGNQPKLQFRYLMLRKECNVAEYLNYFPEHKTLFAKYRRNVHLFTDKLHSNYVACYVRKEKPLREYSPEFRTNMYKLHELYNKILHSQGLIVKKSVVVDYVNNLEPAILMHCINFQSNEGRRKTNLNINKMCDSVIEQEDAMDTGHAMDTE